MIIDIDKYTPESLLVASVAIVLILFGFILIGIKFKKRLRRDHFTRGWRNLQQKLPQRENWRDAVVEADNLLDDAMKKKKIKGKKMGERLANAQKHFSDNDAVWYGHRLRKKIDSDVEYKPKKSEVKKALLALRKGLKDIGAL